MKKAYISFEEEMIFSSDDKSPATAAQELEGSRAAAQERGMR